MPRFRGQEEPLPPDERMDHVYRSHNCRACYAARDDPEASGLRVTCIVRDQTFRSGFCSEECGRELVACLYANRFAVGLLPCECKRLTVEYPFCASCSRGALWVKTNCLAGMGTHTWQACSKLCRAKLYDILRRRRLEVQTT